MVGSLQNRSYEDKEGIKRTVTDIVADEVEFLTPKGSGEDRSYDDAPAVKRERPVLEQLDDDDQLPF